MLYLEGRDQLDLIDMISYVLSQKTWGFSRSENVIGWAALLQYTHKIIYLPFIIIVIGLLTHLHSTGNGSVQNNELWTEALDIELSFKVLLVQVNSKTGQTGYVDFYVPSLNHTSTAQQSTALDRERTLTRVWLIAMWKHCAWLSWLWWTWWRCTRRRASEKELMKG